MSYAIEYAKSDRGACKGPVKACPSSDRTVSKGELRLGTKLEVGHGGYSWRHWLCTTSAVFKNMKEKLSGPEELEGWGNLRDDDQERIKRAWKHGEIPENERAKPTEQIEASSKSSSKQHENGSGSTTNTKTKPTKASAVATKKKETPEKKSETVNSKEKPITKTKRAKKEPKPITEGTRKSKRISTKLEETSAPAPKKLKSTATKKG